MAVESKNLGVTVENQNHANEHYFTVIKVENWLMKILVQSLSTLRLNLIITSLENKVCVCVWGGGGGGTSKSHSHFAKTMGT